ncbi:MAG: UDP-2,3-diacylglucosamine diphosphatase [Gammaproteobacteria bacterium]
MAKLTLRSLWISDVHLGTRHAKAEYLLDFLNNTESDYLYLVGDIIDIWKMKTGWYWPALNNAIVQTVLDKARKGTKVVYVPGNHDEMFRAYRESYFAGVQVRPEAMHTSADGRRYLILHGDEFDYIVCNSKWLAYVGGEVYDFLLWLNRWFNVARRKLGFPYWSLSAYIKHKVKNAVQYIGDFEAAVAREAARRGVGGVICGHIHHAQIADFDGLVYANCGDWVESCTALAEDYDGKLRVIHWVEESAALIGTEPEISWEADGGRPAPSAHAGG